MKKLSYLSSILLLSIFWSCSKTTTNVTPPATAKDFTKAVKPPIDRFVAPAATFFVRNVANGLPAANAPIDFDALFLTQGYGPDGKVVKYYILDAQSKTPDDIYVFFKKSTPNVEFTDQYHVIPTIPGDMGYNDFWRVTKVIVPDNYVANSLTNETAIMDAAKAGTVTLIPTNVGVNCPVVPFGSTAKLTYGKTNTPQALVNCWYKDQAVVYFFFTEKTLTLTDAKGVVLDDTKALTTATGDTRLPLDDIYVFLAVPGDPTGGFLNDGTAQTHNVIAHIPTAATYSSLWTVHVFNDNGSFSNVTNLMTAQGEASTVQSVVVNCPTVQ